jgi:hypothetical protein
MYLDIDFCELIPTMNFNFLFVFCFCFLCVDSDMVIFVYSTVLGIFSIFVDFLFLLHTPAVKICFWRYIHISNKLNAF